MMSISMKGIAMQTKMLLAVLACAALPVWAQTQPLHHQTKAQANKAAKSQSALGSTKAVGKAKALTPIAKTAPVLPAALAAMPMGDVIGSNEIAIAERVHQGHLACELGASVSVEADTNRPGYFNLHGKGFRYHMHPVSTSTGAIRLEDKKAGAVWLQLANKSMLMDQNKGRRIADECAHPEQVAFAQDMKNNPPPKLFDTTGMGR